MISKSIGIVLLAVVAGVAIRPTVSRPSTDYPRTQPPNPCEGVLEGNLELAVSRSGSLASETDSLTVEFRAELGLQQWPEDSVVATADSLLCAHVDSLIGVWHATPAGTASGVVRNAYWGPTAVVRINPAEYYVSPGLVDNEGRDYNFIVDSVGGGVHFWKGVNQ